MAAERDSHPPASRRRARAASGSQIATPNTRGRPDQNHPDQNHPEQNRPDRNRPEPQYPEQQSRSAPSPYPPVGALPPEAHDRARVEVRRSARRSRTVSAYREGDRTVVLIPARMSHAEEQRWVAQMLEKLAAQESRRVPGDEALMARARELSAAYLGDRAHPSTVRWVTNQNSRWGSCTPSEGTIRLSHRLQGMPEYVLDYVLLHELAHLLVPDHGPAFWALLEAYPRTERARGYLEGVVSAARLPHIPGARHADQRPDPASSCD